MKHENNSKGNIELRSGKVRRLLGDIPRSLVIWGYTIILAIILALSIIICSVPYPHSQGECILQHWMMMF